MNRAAKVILVLFILFVLALGGALYFFWQYKSAQTVSTGTTGDIVSLEEVDRTVARVSQHVLLPEDETPTVATITDVEALAGQEFFKNAKVGHKVLVYAQARMAVLYDPEIDRVVNMAQISPTDVSTENPAPELEPVSSDTESTGVSGENEVGVIQ